MQLAPKNNPWRVVSEKDLHLSHQVKDVECQKLFDKIPRVEDIPTLRAAAILEKSLEPICLEKTQFQQSRSSKTASDTLSMATYILSWVTFTLPGASYTLHWPSRVLSGASYAILWAPYIMSSRTSSILSSTTAILFSVTSTILAWATYTTSFTFIVLLTTLCLVTSNPRLSIILTFIMLLFIFCLKSKWGRRSKIYFSCCF